jgi:uncharacterized cupredoxin-like copper-binding protein
MRRFVVASLAPVLAVVAAGCGSSSSSSSTKSSSTPAAAPTTTAAPAAASGPHTIAVGETEYKLTPSTPSVKSGTVTIVARNNGKITHAIEVEGGGAGGKDVKTSSIAPGQSATLKVDLKPGKTYEWYCPIDGHKGLGMKGTITVAGAASSTASSSAKTSTSSGASGTSGGSSGGSSGGGGYGY